MPQAWFVAVFVALTAAVVLALFLVMWRERTSPRTASIAVAGGVVLAAWAIATGILAANGVYLPPKTQRPPPTGIQLVGALIGVALALVASPSLRSLLTNQKNLIRLNVWRLVGAVFLILMVTRQMPALWAIPTGLGDILVGAWAFWVAGQLDAPGGSRRAIIFNVLGLVDLVVAVTLGITTSPPQFFRTTPTSELATRFPLALVPGFLVPLAVMLHIVSLWQLSGRPWVRPGASR
jgi:hypothetical protein